MTFELASEAQATVLMNLSKCVIINLTQHSATAEQLAQRVVDVPASLQQCLIALLTFDTLPTAGEILKRSAGVARLALEAAHELGVEAEDCMIGGAPFFMGPLERALERAGLTPIYAFSRRESVDQPQPDGSVRKVAIFRHAGWIESVVDLED